MTFWVVGLWRRLTAWWRVPTFDGQIPLIEQRRRAWRQETR